MGTHNGFYWNDTWQASLTSERRFELGDQERLHVRRHMDKMFPEELDRLLERISMFERGEPCPDCTDVKTLHYDVRYGSRVQREQDIQDALRELDEFLRQPHHQGDMS